MTRAGPMLKIMKKNKSCVVAFLITVCLVYPWSKACGAEKGTWDLSENGKHWMFFYSPGNPAEDEWIEYEGKEYYLDSKGYMKTGWVTDKEDGNKYYLGEDGAKCFNTFTPDGHYVGPDGIILKSFDTYRKAVKKELSALLKDKQYKAAASQSLPGFLLIDLNGDDYLDIAVVHGADSQERVLLAAVWKPGEEEIIRSAESDFTGTGESRLLRNPKTGSVWLVADAGNGWDRDYSVMDENGSYFENVWHFSAELDDWGEPEYYVNGQKYAQEDWFLAMAMAEEEAGDCIKEGCLPLDEEHIKQAVDREPGPEDLPLWQP